MQRNATVGGRRPIADTYPHQYVTFRSDSDRGIDKTFTS